MAKVPLVFFLTITMTADVLSGPPRVAEVHDLGQVFEVVPLTDEEPRAVLKMPSMISDSVTESSESIANVIERLPDVTAALHEHSPETSERPPEFAKPLPDWPDRDYYDDSGPPIPLECRLVSHLNSSIYWYKDGSILRQRSGIYELSDNGQSLSLVLPKQDQTGVYMCLANNTAGSVNHTGYVLITARHEETRPRVSQTDPIGLVSHVTLGSSVNISCEFDVGGSETALMDLSVNWLLNGRPVNDTERTTWGISTTRSNNQLFSLTIHQLQAEDYGQYECIGRNAMGNDSKVIAITKPLPNKGTSLLLIIGVSVAVGVTLIGGVTTLFLWQRRRMHQKYKELEWPEPDVKGFTVPDEPPQYDVFISYSSDDLTWVKDELYTNLVDRNYAVCIDFKDFVPGMAVSENIIEAIYKSRRTIVVWSANFLKSLWGQFELQQAHHRTIIQRKDALVLIRYDESHVPAKLLGQTFLDWSDEQVRPHFWTRLFEALGEPTNLTQDEVTPNDWTTEHGNNDNYGEIDENTPQKIKDIQIDAGELEKEQADSLIDVLNENNTNDDTGYSDIRDIEQRVEQVDNNCVHPEISDKDTVYTDSNDSGLVQTARYEDDSFILNSEDENLVAF